MAFGSSFGVYIWIKKLPPGGDILIFSLRASSGSRFTILNLRVILLVLRERQPTDQEFQWCSESKNNSIQMIALFFSELYEYKLNVNYFDSWNNPEELLNGVGFVLHIKFGPNAHLK